jgi:death-on-curing protein
VNAADGCLHLELAHVLEIHEAVLKAFGGGEGIRDLNLLESAVAAPQATFGGTSVYSDLVEVGAAYLFFLCRNHPFIDGNKRVALASCLVFLRLNGIEPESDSQAWETLTLDVAASRLDRDGTASRLRELVPTAV